MDKFENVSEAIYRAVDKSIPWHRIPLMPLNVAPIVLVDIHMLIRRETQEHIQAFRYSGV